MSSLLQIDENRILSLGDEFLSGDMFALTPQESLLINKSVNSTSDAVPKTFVESVEVDGNLVKITQNDNGVRNVTEFHSGVKELEFDETTQRIKTKRPIQSTLEAFYFRDQHKLSSGAENVFFTNKSSDIDWFPVWQGIKDQSVPANQDSTGVFPPTARTYSNQMVGVKRYGPKIDDVGTDFMITNSLVQSISAYGFEFFVAEEINEDIYLQLTVSSGTGREIFTQTFYKYTRLTGQKLILGFENPLEGHIGQTQITCIKKKSVANDEDLGFLQVERATDTQSDGTIVPYIELFIRTHEDKELAFKSKIDQLRTRIAALETAAAIP